MPPRKSTEAAKRADEADKEPPPDPQPRQEGSWPLVNVALAQVMRQIPAIGKGSYNEQQGFWYRAYDDVVKALQPIMAEAGLVTVPSVESVQWSTREGRNKTMSHCTVRVSYMLTAEDGSFVMGAGMGEAMDVGDKALNKALTNADKYFLCQLFKIPTGDAEADGEANEGAAPAQQTRQAPQGRQGQPQGQQQQAGPDGGMPPRNNRGRAERVNSRAGRRPADETTPWHTGPPEGGPMNPQFADEAASDPPQEPPKGMNGKIDLAKLGDDIRKVPETFQGIEMLRGWHNDVGQSVQANLTDPQSGQQARKLIKIRADQIQRRLDEANQGQ